MTYIGVYLITLLASLLGPICGIGGGVIIKPSVDAMGILPVTTVSFLSSISVLTMSTSTLIQNKLAHTSIIDIRQLSPLALSSAAGGVIGKILFVHGASHFADPQSIGAVQSLIIICLCALVFIYTLKRNEAKTLSFTSVSARLGIGFIAGTFWAFLGIGGGPFNLALLIFFFSLEIKQAAQSSLYIIFFSQTASLIYTLFSGNVPDFQISLLVGICASALIGSALGRKIARSISSATNDRLYMRSLIVISCLCLYNFLNFL